MSLLDQVYFKKELNILLVAIDVLDIFQLSDVYQMKVYARSWFRVTAFFAQFLIQNRPLQQNVISSLEAYPT